MGDQGWNRMGGDDFDALLESSLTGLPPKDVVKRVTPWKRAMRWLLAGMALTTLTLNVLNLHLLLPAIGMVLLLLGFRALRRENRWFGACYAVTVLRTAYVCADLVLNTTIWQRAVHASSLANALTGLSLALLFMEFFCLWRGLRAVQRKAGETPRAWNAAALMVWYALLWLLALAGDRIGWLLLAAMLAGYALVLRSLWRLSKELDQAGYAVRPAPVRVSDRTLVLALAALLTAGCACGYLLGSRYPMEWTPVEAGPDGEAAGLRAHLLQLGMPEYVLDDLTAEELAACEGALQVVVDVDDEAVDGGDMPKLRVTGVGVEVPGEKERWIIIHHFLWLADPGFHGTEAIQLRTVYEDLPEGWRSAGQVTGRVLYEQNGESYAAPYYFLGERTCTAGSLPWEQHSGNDVFAAFSVPPGGENCRGYLTYSIEEVRDGYIINGWLDYTHQKTWLQYPAVTALERRLAGSWNHDGAFRTIGVSLQFEQTEEGARLLAP
ncbi:hypothetical protein [Flavonifractor sp. An306]|uniref:hypothetical protein n=1 Tax=Flavonifractor sp. An306 TaxID=1965629 RepID=UPI000B376660|nr:hypothetical protein [Flavonifractor sp. An306]OUO42282.1 hypothetical protein B5F88_04655 [Flavonifractor sp. An306]